MNDYQWYESSDIKVMFFGQAFIDRGTAWHYVIVKTGLQDWKLSLIRKHAFEKSSYIEIEPPIPNTILIRYLFELDGKQWKVK